MYNLDALAQQDPDIYRLTLEELERQQNTVELIASENFTSMATLQAMGSVLTNKYAEGLPDKRYYGGCHVVDGVEKIAIDRAKALFGCDHVNVQPHSGAQANMAAFQAAGLKLGDKILGMDLSHGGHLTHGSPVNFSGLNYEVHAYGVDPDTGRIDYDKVRDIALQVKPKLIICGASAYARTIDFPKFRAIADEVGAVVLADIAHIAGLVAAGVHPSPFPHCQLVTTTTHKTLRGPRGGMIMSNEDFAKAIDKAVFPGIQGGPLMHVIAAKAVSFKEALSPEFKRYAQAVVDNAATMAETLISNGVDIVSGGTDNHMMMCDLRRLDLTGKDAQAWLEEVNITANKNTVPNDPKSPFVTSGVRLGTPAITTRGFTVDATRALSVIIANVLTKGLAEADTYRAQVADLLKQYPLYPDALSQQREAVSHR